MTITHASVKATADRGYAAEWNAEHVVTGANLALRSRSLIVAASDSLDIGRADYVCDGTADQVQIQAAIDALAGGGTVMLLEGTFTITGVIELKNYVTLMGQGYGTLITGNPPELRFIRAAAQHDIILRDLRVVGIVGSHNIHFNESYHCLIQNVWCLSAGITGILVSTDSYEIVIQSCICKLCDGSGISIGNAQRCIVANCISSYNGYHGIYLGFSDDCIVTGNEVISNDFGDTASYDGIYIIEGDRNIVSSNRCKNNDRYEINVSDAASDRNLVHGNIAQGADHVGTINDAGTNTTVADNVIL